MTVSNVMSMVRPIYQAALGVIDQGGVVMWPLFACCLWMIWLVSQTLFTSSKKLNKKQQCSINQSQQFPWLSERLLLLYIRDLQQQQYANLQGVKLLAMIAPLLGLLGTVNGMINMFQAGADVGFHDPAMISTGISMAMITTQTGLIVGLSGALLAFFWQRKLNIINSAFLSSQSGRNHDAK